MSLRLTSHQPLKEDGLDFDSQDWEIFPESYRMSAIHTLGMNPKAKISWIKSKQGTIDFPL